MIYFNFLRLSINKSTASLNFVSDFVPVQTIFPLLNNKKVALVPGNLYTNPGNCSGSYSVFSSFIANEFRFKSILIVPEATIFCTIIFGLTVIFILIFLKFSIILFIDSLTLPKDFAPVQTTFPELKINAEVLGFLILITRPGNCSGLYSV